jgi:hypothetical protein
MTDKHSPVHPALRVDFVSAPWKRRRRINFNAWARITPETQHIPAVPSAPVPLLPRSGLLRRDRVPPDVLALMGEILVEKTEEDRRPLAKSGL